MALKLPTGFKFCPSDQELLMNYLKPKIQGNLPWDHVIEEKDIYGPNANPWEIFDESSTQWITSGNEKTVYVFARLTKMADKESSGEGHEVHYVRKAGCGTWHVETGRKFVKDGDHTIGETRMLVFQINDVNGVGDGGNHYWKMHEFFLKGHEDYVVCRITLDMIKPAKVSTKDVSGRRRSTKSKADKKISSSCGTKDESGKAGLVESLSDSGKEVASVHDSGVVVNGNDVVGGGETSMNGFSYENQGCYEENSKMMIYQTLQEPMNALCWNGSDQWPILNDGMPRYVDAGGSSGVEGQGLEVPNDDQRQNNEEAAQPVIGMCGGFQNPGTVLSDGEVFTDLDDLLSDDFWSNIDNVLMMEPPMLNIDVSLGFEDLFDAGSWADKNLEEIGRVNNNVQEQQQQQPQQPERNMSCVVGKRESSEAQEEEPTKKPRI